MQYKKSILTVDGTEWSLIHINDADADKVLSLKKLFLFVLHLLSQISGLQKANTQCAVLFSISLTQNVSLALMRQFDVIILF